MVKKKIKTLKVAAVQCLSENGKIEANLERALKYVKVAAEKGAKLILLPEFLPTGYIFTPAIWDAGEPTNGTTVQWLREHSKRLGVYMGTSFLEADGLDFFNTFVLTTPDGKDAGRVRKETPASFEAYFTKGDRSDHIIETDIGKIGVGICYENMLAYTPELMYTHSADLLLMPHSAPSPQANFFMPRKMIDTWDSILKDQPRYYADTLGIPTVMTNKCGPWSSPLPGLPMKQKASFPGFSAIADSDGKVKAQFDDEEGVLVDEVTLDPSRKTGTKPLTCGRWSQELPWSINTFRLVEALGRSWYRRSWERKRRAMEISSRA